MVMLQSAVIGSCAALQHLFRSLCGAPPLSASLGWQRCRSLGTRPGTASPNHLLLPLLLPPQPTAEGDLMAHVPRHPAFTGSLCLRQASRVARDEGRRRRGEGDISAKTASSSRHKCVVNYLLPSALFPLPPFFSLSLYLSLATHPLPIKHV